MAIMEVCPQCHKQIKSPHARLVQDSCGHKKCRLCLMIDEDGCRMCAAKHISGNRKEPGGKKLSLPPTNIRRRSQRKLSTGYESNISVISRSTAEKCVSSRSHKYIKKYLKENKKSVPKIEIDGERTNIVSDDKHHSRLSDERSYKEVARIEEFGNVIQPEVSVNEPDCKTESNNFETVVIKQEADKKVSKFEADVNVPDAKTDNEDLEAVEMKVERKRKPMLIANHITIVQGNPTMYTCTVCVKTFKWREHVRYHNFCATGEKPFKCETCGQGFASKAHYECHCLNHTGVRPFVCEVCNRGFRQKDKLTRHMRIHTGERPYVCQECGKCFIASYSLKTHQRTHTGDKPYLCPHCGRGFTETVNLRKHILVHTGEKNFMCEDCGKSFGHKWALVHHQRTHSLDRPHRCQKCPRAFTNNKDLKRHYSVHSDVRPYSCSICDTAFRRKDNLERHMKNTHPETRVPSLNLLNKNCSEQLSNTTTVHQQKLTTGTTTPHTSTITNNSILTSQTIETFSNNAYKKVPEQVDNFCISASSFERNDTKHITSTQAYQLQQSSCIKTTSRSVNPEISSTDMKTFSNSCTSEFDKLTDLAVSRDIVAKYPSQTRLTRSFKNMLDPVHDMSIENSKNSLYSINETNIGNFKEIVTPVEEVTITRLLDPIRTSNITNFRDVLDPVHDMGIENFKEVHAPPRDTNITSFKEMLEPIQTPNIFSSGSLFQQIPEAKQKSQAVPVINRPITPIIYNHQLGRSVKTSVGKEGVIMEGTNCVPTITKTSNILHSSTLNATNCENNVLTIVNATSLQSYACKKSGKVLDCDNRESYNQIASKNCIQNDLHWRKRTVELLHHQQLMVEDSEFT